MLWILTFLKILELIFNMNPLKTHMDNEKAVDSIEMSYQKKQG